MNRSPWHTARMIIRTGAVVLAVALALPAGSAVASHRYVAPERTAPSAQLISNLSYTDACRTYTAHLEVEQGSTTFTIYDNGDLILRRVVEAGAELTYTERYRQGTGSHRIVLKQDEWINGLITVRTAC